jgi:hypothetical protein
MYVKKNQTKNKSKNKSKLRKKSKHIKTQKNKRGGGRGNKTLNKMNKNTYGIMLNYLRPNNLYKLTQTSKEMKMKTKNTLEKQAPLIEAKNKLASILILSDLRTIIKRDNFDNVNLSENSVLLDVIDYPLLEMVKCIWDEDGRPNNIESNNNENDGIRSKYYYFCVDQLFNFQEDDNGEKMDTLISLDEESIIEIEDIYLMKHLFIKQHPEYSKIKYVIKIMNGENNKYKLNKLIDKIKVFQSSATLKNYKDKYNEIVDDIFDIGMSVFTNTKDDKGFELLATFSIFGDSVINKEVFDLKIS